MNLPKPLFLLFAVFSLSVAQAQTKEDNVAPTFKGFTGVLLLLQNHQFGSHTWVDESVEKHFSKNYSGQFQLVDSLALTRRPFKDSTKYRFAAWIVVERVGGGSTPDLSHFVMVDRLTGEFFTSRTYQDWVYASRKYSKLLNDLRSKN